MIKTMGLETLTWAAVAALIGAAACGPGDDGGVPEPCGDGWILVPAGAFAMGSPVDEVGRQVNEGDDDGGTHEVTFAAALCVKATEVTQAEWRAALGTEPSQHAGCDGCPVECVNWYEALAWCNARSVLDGLAPCYVLDGWDGTGCGGVAPGTPGACNGNGGMVCAGATLSDPECPGYRLPSEAEWEHAARAGTVTATYGGDLPPDHLACRTGNPALDAIAWFCGNSGMASHPVGPSDPAPRRPNGWGLHDALGNVAEWVQDRIHPTYAGAPVDGTAWESGSGHRVVRGGSWLSDAWVARAAARRVDDPRRRLGDVGFRPVRRAP